jgi:hypothetical protein
VNFDALAGKTYRLEHTGALPANAWSSLAPLLAAVNGTMALTHSNTLAQTPRFYRIRLDE